MPAVIELSTALYRDREDSAQYQWQLSVQKPYGHEQWEFRGAPAPGYLAGKEGADLREILTYVH